MFDWHGFEQERRFYVDMYECLFFLIVAHFILDTSREIEVFLAIGNGYVVDVTVGRNVWLLRMLALIEDGN